MEASLYFSDQRVPGARLELAPVVLTVRNQRDDGQATRVLLFKRDGADPDAAPVAWKVVRCAAGQSVRVTFPFDQQIGVFHANGSPPGLLDVMNGERLRIDAGGAVRPDTARAAESTAPGSNLVSVRNDSKTEQLDVLLYKDGRPMSRRTGLAPGATALFDVLPCLYMAIDGAPRLAGAGSADARPGPAPPGIEEGGAVPPALAARATRLSLLGLQAADLIVGGGDDAVSLRLVHQRFS